MSEKLLRSHITVLAAYPEAFADPAKPTVAELNDQWSSTNKDAKVFNISCAIADDGFTANVTDSETDDSRTICTVGAQQTPTFEQYEVSFDAFRDKNITDVGVFNTFFNLFNGPDCPYFIVTRIGETNTTAFAEGQDIKMFGVTTDYPTDIVDDNTPIKFGARFQNTGEVLINYRLEG